MPPTRGHALPLLAAALLLAACAAPCAAAPPPSPAPAAPAAMQLSVAQQFAGECLRIGPKKCAEFTVNALKEASAPPSGSGACAVTPKQAAAFRPLSRSPAAWEAFYKATTQDQRCIGDRACTEKAYAGVGANLKGRDTVRAAARRWATGGPGRPGAGGAAAHPAPKAPLQQRR